MRFQGNARIDTHLDSALQILENGADLLLGHIALDCGANLRLARALPAAQKDYERNIASSEAMIYIAMSHIMLRRLARAKN